MNLVIAGAKKTVADSLTVGQAVIEEEAEFLEYMTVTIHNNFVENHNFEQTVLQDGDVVEFLYFMGGSR